MEPMFNMEAMFNIESMNPPPPQPESRSSITKHPPPLYACAHLCQMALLHLTHNDIEMKYPTIMATRIWPL